MIETPSGTRPRREVLTQAARIIEKQGWTTGARGMPGHTENKGTYCILGAVAVAAGYEKLETPSKNYDADYDLATEVLGNDGSMQYWDWNDTLTQVFSPQGAARVVARCLRLMAKGTPFSKAKQEARKAAAEK